MDSKLDNSVLEMEHAIGYSGRVSHQLYERFLEVWFFTQMG